MGKFRDVFERTEKKYRLGHDQYLFVADALREYMSPDEYGCTRVTSLYFDTPERSLISRSLEKPRYKEKIRLRMYGPQGIRLCEGSDGLAHVPGDAPVFLEIKKKFEGVVYKRRVCISLAAARAYWDGEDFERACALHPLRDEWAAAKSLSSKSVQIAREIDRFCERYVSLGPSMAISCERTAWTLLLEASVALAPMPANLRITFDERLQYADLRKASVERRPIIGLDEVIMEVKCAGPYPLWLTHLLSQVKAYPTSFSKYGTAYRAVVAAARASGEAPLAAGSGMLKGVCCA